MPRPRNHVDGTLLQACGQRLFCASDLLSLAKLGPVTLVGLDHVFEDFLGNLHRWHGPVERKGLERLLVRTLDRGLDHELLGVQLLHHKALLEQRNVVAADDLGAVLANVGRQLDHSVVGHVGDSALVLADDQEALLGVVLQSDSQVGNPVAVAAGIERALVDLARLLVVVDAVEEVLLARLLDLIRTGALGVGMLDELLLLQVVVQVRVGQVLREALHDLVLALPDVGGSARGARRWSPRASWT